MLQPPFTGEVQKCEKKSMTHQGKDNLFADILADWQNDA
jgi:hypothetical protein